jgi:hypothetical protein
MHTYKSIYIYIYVYMLCTKRFVVIFVVIVWKTTLNTSEKLERDYLRRLFEEDHLRRIIWKKSFKKNHLRRIIWERSFERDHLRKIIWERETAKEKYLIQRNGIEYWENWDIKREQIDESYWLKFLVFVSSVSIFDFVLSYQIFFLRCFSQMILLKESLSNDSLRITSANNFFQAVQAYSTQSFRRLRQRLLQISSYTAYMHKYI